MNSPLGKYAPIVAAITGVGVVAAFIASVMFQHALALAQADVNALKDFALLAMGAIFGSAVVANGHKEPLRQAAVANARLDLLGAPHVAPTEIVSPP